jgi:hypothetical protein
MLTNEEIMNNKATFISLVEGIEREGVDKERLIKKLESSDWFTAPASTVYHSSYEGGLCAHSLSVYYTLKNFMDAIYPMRKLERESDDQEEVRYESTCPYSEDTIRIVALFHDFDKMNKYEKSVRNQKIYSEKGSKKDELGKFDWVSIPSFKWKEDKDLFIMGTHGENSVYMTETFIPLTVEEHCAIVNHHGLFDNPKLNVASIFGRYSLACLLHLADMASTYILEKDE